MAAPDRWSSGNERSFLDRIRLTGALPAPQLRDQLPQCRGRLVIRAALRDHAFPFRSVGSLERSELAHERIGDFRFKRIDLRLWHHTGVSLLHALGVAAEERVAETIEDRHRRADDDRVIGNLPSAMRLDEPRKLARLTGC